VFHNKLLVGYRGQALHEVQHLLGEVSDATVLALREILGERFGTDFGNAHVRDAVTGLAHRNRFDPICDMLAEAQGAWDGVERLDRFAVEYLNTEDTPLNRAIGRKTLIAAARRARRPGVKFDNITVLESEEGFWKSTAWRVLAGDNNFSDESILGKNSREVQEHLAEVWIHESADLAGMRKAEVETIKAFASRQVDIARPAYGYFLRKQPRHAINVGTTNSDQYLQSQTGNRRFWPLKVLAPIDIEKLERDRLQLWGEDAHYEVQGESLVLSEELWADAKAEQEKRRVVDPWEDRLANLKHEVPDARDSYKTVKLIHRFHWNEREFVASDDLLTHVLRVPIERQDRYAAGRLADAMRHNGWERYRHKLDGVQRRGFARLTGVKLPPLPLEKI
jgi:predicted P-loop ATPase